MATHTPTPWRREQECYRPQDGVIVGANGQTICRLARTLQDGNAAYLLRAVNSHEALLAAAREVLERHPAESTSPEYNRRVQALRAAIKLAEEA